MINTLSHNKGLLSHDTETKTSGPSLFSYLFSSTPVASTESKTEDRKDTGKEVSDTNNSLIKLGAMSTFASMFSDSNKVYNFRLSKSAQHVTSGAGLMALATSIVPSSFLQYAPLLLLFSQCRARHVRIQMVSNVNPNGSSGGSSLFAGGTLALGFNPRPASGASPVTSVAEVLALPGVKLYNPLTIVRPVIVTYKFPRNLPWSQTSASASGQAPVDSTYGYFSHCSVGNTLTASTAYTTYLVEVEYEFRGLNAVSV